MVVLFNQIGNYFEPVLGVATGFFYGFLQIALIFGVLGYIWIYTSFNVKIMVRQMTRGNRTIVEMVRAKKSKEKNLDHPKLQLFGTLGFGGKKITQPPTDCIYPYKSKFGNTTLYDFVVKDAIYYPISNAVLGKKYIVTDKDQPKVDEELNAWAKEKGYEIKENPGDQANVIYSMEGSGLETSRDFEAEQATLNDLISAAERYKNKKPGEIYMLYGVVILAIVGGFVTVVYSLYKAGEVTSAVNQGWELFRAWTEIAQATKQGPG